MDLKLDWFRSKHFKMISKLGLVQLEIFIGAACSVSQFDTTTGAACSVAQVSFVAAGWILQLLNVVLCPLCNKRSEIKQNGVTEGTAM